MFRIQCVGFRVFGFRLSNARLKAEAQEIAVAWMTMFAQNLLLFL